MAEIAGLAIGMASLAGLFTTCTELLDKIDRIRGFGGSYQNTMLQFKACQHLFEEWGRRAGLGVQNPGETTNSLSQLSDMTKRSLVYNVLASIEQLFVDSEDLQKRYGISLPHHDPPSTIDSAGLSLLQARKQASDGSSFKRKVLWAIRDERKFHNLVSLLGGLTNRLYELVPVGDGIAELTDEMKVLRLEIDGIPNLVQPIQSLLISPYQT